MCIWQCFSSLRQGHGTKKYYYLIFNNKRITICVLYHVSSFVPKLNFSPLILGYDFNPVENQIPDGSLWPKLK